MKSGLSTLKECEAGDGMKTCTLDVAPTTLLGCYYFYEK
jgi:hypothetical protein